MLAKKTQPGFTLVELLVVIAIISVLAALLLPSLEKSLAQARLLSCANNVRQIGVGVLSYTDDQDGLLPGPTSMHTISLSVSLYAGYGWAPYAPKGLGYAANGDYFGSRDVLYCPAAAYGRSWKVKFDSIVIPDNPGLSCFTNEFATAFNPFMPPAGTTKVHRVCGYSFIPRPQNTRLSQIPTTTPMLCDFILAYDWHEGTWNRLYSDGHVKARTSELAVNRCLQQFSTYAGPANWADNFGIFNEICAE